MFRRKTPDTSRHAAAPAASPDASAEVSCAETNAPRYHPSEIFSLRVHKPQELHVMLRAALAELAAEEQAKTELTVSVTEAEERGDELMARMSSVAGRPATVQRHRRARRPPLRSRSGQRAVGKS